jgi:hypothetical protein
VDRSVLVASRKAVTLGSKGPQGKSLAQMIDVVELTMSGRNRFALKQTLAGLFYLELLRPGTLKDDHGWLVRA